LTSRSSQVLEIAPCAHWQALCDLPEADYPALSCSGGRYDGPRRWATWWIKLHFLMPPGGLFDASGGVDVKVVTDLANRFMRSRPPTDWSYGDVL